MLSQLPEQTNPWRLCEQGKFYEGSIALQNLHRLAPLLASTEGEVDFTLEFDRDLERRRRIRGHITAKLVVTCQRCIHDMPLDVDNQFQLSPVKGPQEAENLPSEYDPLLLDDDMLNLLDLVEDELILAIPPAPRHAEEHCTMDLAKINNQVDPLWAAAKQEVAKDSPFAALAGFKPDRKEND